MPISVPIYSEQPLTADAMKIIEGVLAEYPPGTFEFRDATTIMQGKAPYVGHSWINGVLVFGSTRLFGAPFSAPWKLIHTISIAQITTKANAISILKAALDQFYLPQKVHPKRPMPLWAWSSLNGAAPTAIDIETSGNLDDTLPEDVDIINIAFYQEGKWAYLNKEEFDASHPGGDGGYFTWYDAVRAAVEHFKNPIWHNGKFDIRVIEAKTGFRPCMFFDTMLAHHVLNQAARDHKLKHLARQYLGAPEWEADLSKYTVGGAYYERIPKDKLIEYNLWDVYWTYELWKFLQPQILADEHASTAFMVEMSASDFLLDVEQNGFAIDMSYTQQLAWDMEQDIKMMLTALEMKYSNLLPQKTNKKGLVLPVGVYNPGSWQQTQRVLSALLGTTYSDSTDEKHLEKLKASKNDPKIHIFIDELLAYRGITKAYSTYVKGALDRQKNGRVHTTFLIHGTTTGRLSSAGPNLQNIPRDKKYRSIYIG